MPLTNTKVITDIVKQAAAKARQEVSNEPEAALTQAIDWPVECTVGPGLEGAIACETKIGYVNGTRGALIYRGYDIFDLCAEASFEEVSYLLLHGNLPTMGDLGEFQGQLQDFRFIPKTLRLIMGFPVENMNPMAALRMGTNLMRQDQTERDRVAAVSQGTKVIASDDDSIPMEKLPRGDRRAVYEFSDRNANRPQPAKAKREHAEARGLESCYHLIAGVGTLTAAIERVRKGHLPIEPDPELNHAGNLLYMMTGRKPQPVEQKIMDICLMLHADHGMNASTFAAMVVASTLSDIYFSIGSGIGALNGPLHGGANEAVIHMLREIGPPENVAKWYGDARENKRKIMGFGHRVYKAYDPRARVLGPLAEFLVERSGRKEMASMLATAKELEKRVVGDLGERKGIFPNVDFYSGIVYSCLDIPPEMFTPIFAVSRVAGWTARVLEYLKKNRIFRPRAIYVGELDRQFQPLRDRS
jgi:citrate synthase